MPLNFGAVLLGQGREKQNTWMPPSTSMLYSDCSERNVKKLEIGKSRGNDGRGGGGNWQSRKANSTAVSGKAVMTFEEVWMHRSTKTTFSYSCS